MNNLMVTFLSLSLSGSILIAVLFLCKPLYKERLSKRWQYYIWLVVVARLLVPFSFEVNLIGSLFSGINEMSVAFQEETVSSTTANDIIIMESHEVHSQDVTSQISTLYPQTNIPSGLISNIWLIWIGVAIILLVRKISIYQSFANYIKAGRVEITNMEILEQFGKIAEELKIKKMIRVYTNSLISSPLLIGFFKPYIVLPSLEENEADFRYTAIHELTHYKRGDMFYKWLIQFTICLHWFNPLVYLMGREINNACEFSCDESVIKSLDSQEIKAYGNTLLNALGIGGEYKNALSTVTLSENKKILEERLDMIQNFKKKSKFAVVCAVLLVLVLGMGAGVAGVYGMANDESPVNTVNEIVENIAENITLSPAIPQTSVRTIDDFLDRQLAEAYTFAENKVAQDIIFAEEQVAASGNRPDRREWADEWIASRYQWKEEWIAGRHEWAAEIRDLYDSGLLTIFRNENGDIVGIDWDCNYGVELK